MRDVTRASLALLLLVWLTGTLRAAEPAWDLYADTWVATDALGRNVATHDVTGDVRKDKTVGIFYFTWLGQHDREVFDISKILAANPKDPQWGPRGAFHWWGEPLFGYYQSADEWVIRKHAQMLSDAGVDVIILDVTNARTYAKVYLTICKVYEQMREQGQRTPQICFIANSESARTVHRLYDEFYTKKLYPDLWFRWRGKPLLLAPDEGLRPEVREFFTIRRSWAWTKGQGWFGDGRDKWPWLDHTPQRAGWHDSPESPEEISVAVAEHPVSNIGRSFHKRQEPEPGERATAKGLYFAEQWRRAFKVDPAFVFVTGWNEWVAQRFVADGSGNPHMLGHPTARGESFFVDEYSQEFSRDIEPMTGGHGDSYYYQLVDNVRRYKGTRPIPPVSARPVTIDGKFDDWAEVGPEFRDTIGDPVRRDVEGFDPKTRYRNETGRNDLVLAKVSYDARNVYFYVRTREAITTAKGKNWMLLFIDVDHDARTGWLGYDFVVNRVNVRAEVTTLEHATGNGYAWQKAADIAYRVSGNELELSIPRASLGITKLPATLDFKWADNIEQTGDATDFMLNGDVAPNDRFNYRATLK